MQLLRSSAHAAALWGLVYAFDNMNGSGCWCSLAPSSSRWVRARIHVLAEEIAAQTLLCKLSVIGILSKFTKEFNLRLNWLCSAEADIQQPFSIMLKILERSTEIPLENCLKGRLSEAQLVQLQMKSVVNLEGLPVLNSLCRKM